MSTRHVAELNEDGRLAEQHRPAVYFDTNVLIEYWTVFRAKEPPLLEPRQEELAIRALFRADRRRDGMIKVRDLVERGSKLQAVTTPFAFLEMLTVFVDGSFRSYVAGLLGKSALDRKGNKHQVGEMLVDISKIARGAKLPPGGAEREGFERLWHGLNTGLERAGNYEREGVLLAEVQHFNMWLGAAWQAPADLAYAQVQGADILHILFAQHLGCEFIASFDQDLRRARETLAQSFGLTLLATPEELASAL
jgi:hypothetical protein